MYRIGLIINLVLHRVCSLSSVLSCSVLQSQVHVCRHQRQLPTHQSGSWGVPVYVWLKHTLRSITKYLYHQSCRFRGQIVHQNLRQQSLWLLSMYRPYLTMISYIWLCAFIGLFVLVCTICAGGDHLLKCSCMLFEDADVSEEQNWSRVEFCDPGSAQPGFI